MSLKRLLITALVAVAPLSGAEAAFPITQTQTETVASSSAFTNLYSNWYSFWDSTYSSEVGNVGDDWDFYVVAGSGLGLPSFTATFTSLFTDYGPRNAFFSYNAGVQEANYTAPIGQTFSVPGPVAGAGLPLVLGAFAWGMRRRARAEAKAA